MEEDSGEMTNHPSLENLANETLSLVTGYIEEGDVINTSLTSTRLRDICRENRGLWQNLAIPFLQLNSDVSAPLERLSSLNEIAPVSNLRSAFFDCKQRLHQVVGRMRHGGQPSLRHARDFEEIGSLKILCCNTAMDKILLYFRSGLTQIFTMEEFCGGNPPHLSFTSLQKIRKITFLDHSIVMGPPSRNSELVASLFSSSTGLFYGNLLSSGYRHFLALTINEYYAVIVTKIPEMAQNTPNSHRLCIYRRATNNDQTYFFELTHLEMGIPGFADISLDDEYRLAIYDHNQFLRVYNLGKPENVYEGEIREGEEDGGEGEEVREGEEGVWGRQEVERRRREAGEAQTRRRSSRGEEDPPNFSPRLEITRDFTDPPSSTPNSDESDDTVTSSDSNDTTEYFPNPIYEHLYRSHKLKRFNIMPAHIDTHRESKKIIANMTIGNFWDSKYMLEMRSRGDEMRVVFKGCDCPICTLGIFPAPRRRETIFYELSKGFGYLFAYKSIVTLVRFDTHFYERPMVRVATPNTS